MWSTKCRSGSLNDCREVDIEKENKIIYKSALTESRHPEKKVWETFEVLKDSVCLGYTVSRRDFCIMVNITLLLAKSRFGKV